jgi:hypothetical protein
LIGTPFAIARSRRREMPGRRQARGRRARAYAHVGKRSRHQRDDAERRLADRERRIAALEMERLVLGDLDVEERERQRAVASTTATSCRRRRLRRARRRRRAAALSALRHLVDSRREPVGRPVGQAMIVVVNAGERRVDRAQR